MPITHTDGKEYFSQAEMEAAIKDRVKTKDAEIDGLNTKIKGLEPELAKVMTLAQERDALKARADQAEGRFGRYQAAAAHGITDPETIEALEGAHAKAMGKVEESKRTDFGGYLNAVKADPSLLPAYLRGAIQGGAPAPTTPASTSDPAKPAASQEPAQPQRPAWASATEGVRQPAAGTSPAFSQRVKAATTLDELAKLNQERRAGRV